MYSRNVNNKYCVVTHQCSKVCSQQTMPGDGNSILQYVHIVLVSYLPRVAAGYRLGIFAFYIQCLILVRVSHSSSNVAREIRISQEPQSY